MDGSSPLTTPVRGFCLSRLTLMLALSTLVIPYYLHSRALEEPIFDVPGSSAILDTPLLLFQVTRLTCGGFILAVRVNHTMVDAQGLTQFLGAVAELARGMQAPSVLPVWKRELLEGRNQQQLALVVYDKLDEVPGKDTDTKASSVMLPLDNAALRLRSFFFGPREIAAIRAQLPPHLQKRATKFDAIAGWIWKFRTVALAPNPDEVMELLVNVNARGRKAGIPIGYYGNAFAFPAAISTARELCTNPLSYAVELVKKAKNQVDIEYMRSRVDLIALRRGRSPPITAGMYCLSDLTRARFDNLDFGWGKPVYGGPAPQAIGATPSLPWLVGGRDEQVAAPISRCDPAAPASHVFCQEVSAMNNSPCVGAGYGQNETSLSV
ncbi:hypothetical protein PVAP13_3KG510900 [Panicum virgatum]|uniref:Uncharacterized protein n=1 Tax=Panicum virgatum TaxID=38727 RepID=A0A8T0VAN9_PANVG|nr:hypothetical protein PVAP13_3KG510900 [Panicum virgatum]